MNSKIFRFEKKFSYTQEYLACEEALLDACEHNNHPQILWTWESPKQSVVMGRANKVKLNVNTDYCAKRNIPILRRISGGGTVVLGPGCVSYTLVLSHKQNPELATITSTTQWILKKISAAISPLLSDNIKIEGISDLTYRGKKFSGNAQKRCLKSLLFHGTILFNSDINSIQNTLTYPEKDPEYRKKRSHEDFICNLPLQLSDIQTAIHSEFGSQPLSLPQVDISNYLKKYEDLTWNLQR